MNKKWFLIVVIILTIINISVLGTYTLRRRYHGRENYGLGKDEHFRHLKRKLGLTNEQVVKVKNYRNKFNPKIEVLSKTIKERRLNLVKELMKEYPDSTNIGYILNQLDSSHSALQHEVVNHLLAEKGIFTHEQQEKFFSIVLKRCSER
ncbi:Spy/CpxP family protein refolding chaperone [Candidatus Desantisbacteria bacterium]|nr:Spy/CpxP family protein refolding chaperone [Candidatus Desantisbacteria bacterium]